MVVIQLDSGQHRTLDGRLAKIVRWLMDNQDDIERQAKMTITFDCAGECVTPEIRLRHLPIKS